MNEENKNLNPEKKDDGIDTSYTTLLLTQFLLPAVILYFSLASIVHAYLFGIAMGTCVYSAVAMATNRSKSYFKFAYVVGNIQLALIDIMLLWKLSTFLAFFSLFHIVFYVCGMAIIVYYIRNLIRVNKNLEKYLNGEIKEEDII